jgi:predicted DNA-binding transcriptional regulator AlpA
VPPKRFVTYPQLPDYGVPAYSRKHLLDLQRRGLFPKALQLSPNRIGWDEDSIRIWVASRPVARAVAEAQADEA